MPMFHRITDRAPSSGSLQSKSMGSSEELSHSSTGTYSYSSPENETTCKYSSSFSSKSSERDSPTTHRSQYDCRVRSYGVIEHVSMPSEGSLELINVIDVAQCKERLPLTARSEDFLLLLSQHGLRIFDPNMQDTLLRIPLYKIERVVCFDDGIGGDVILAFKVVNSKKDYDVYVYACENEESCQKICHKFSRVIDSVMSSATNAGVTSSSGATEREGSSAKSRDHESSNDG